MVRDGRGREEMAKTIVRADSLADPTARAYSHGVRMGNLLFLAGQTSTAGGLGVADGIQGRHSRTQGTLEADV